MLSIITILVQLINPTNLYIYRMIALSFLSLIMAIAYSQDKLFSIRINLVTPIVMFLKEKLTTCKYCNKSFSNTKTNIVLLNDRICKHCFNAYILSKKTQATTLKCVGSNNSTVA